MLLSLAACGQTPKETAPQESPPPPVQDPVEEGPAEPDPVTIRFWQAGGDIADVLVVGSPLDFQLSNEGALLALDDLLDPAIKADISDVLLNECIYSCSENEDMVGKIMSLPLYTGTRATTSEQYLNFAWNYGAVLVDPATWTAGTDSDAWRKGIEDYLKFYTEGVTPEGSVAMDGATLFNMFANGKVAMLCGAVDYAQTLVGEGWTEEKLGIAALPGEDFATCYCGADILVVPNKGEATLRVLPPRQPFWTAVQRKLPWLSVPQLPGMEAAENIR